MRTDETTFDGLLHHEYKQWEKAHAKMKDSPSPNGHDYLKHANNLLVLLEGLAELHPIAKAVVVSFKTVVMFEQDRRENDARVTAVFLAQTDVMRVLLDVDDLASRRRHRPDADVLRSSVTLGDILLAIQKEIKSCGNSIDTYYKESRFVKFWKAQDWKNRMLGHINRFNKFRLELQQTLSVQVASGVEDIVYKMDAVLSRLYSPKYDWERNLDIKTRGPEFSGVSWMENNDTLQNLIWDTNDPSLSVMSPTGSATQDMSVQMASDMQLSKVKREIQLSLDTLCEKNMDMFELRLNFHAQQMEQAIVNSAHLVIQSLSGPSDRLVNEDLRQLWKEMDWIFCVENKFFVSALFEFYLDRFSSNKIVHTFKSPDHENSMAVSGPVNNDGQQSSNPAHWLSLVVSVPKFSFLSRLGALNDPDSWTLEYIALHGHHITQAIDNDSSGFIRISEANAFTQQIPKGWTLPQWCAYSAAGWAYEARIYRRRIGKIMAVVTDMQPRVLESNRTYLIVFSLINFYATYHAFTREPIGQNIPPPTPELRELVKQKVLAQDLLYRGHLQSLRWTIEDESTLHLLYGEMPSEKYILQFGTLMLEQFLAVTNLCCTVTVDAKEWLRLSSAFRVMREISVKRVSELQARFEIEGNKSESIATYYGGIWSFVRQSLDSGALSDGMKPYTAQELTEYLDDLPILDDFPVPTDSSPYLQFPTWEDYIKTVENMNTLTAIPKTWNPINDTALPHLVGRDYCGDFPMTGWGCDRCQRNPIQQKRYRCLNISCPDFDLCQECYSLPESEHRAIHHKYDHHVMLSTLWLMPEQEQKIALEIGLVLDQLRQEINALQRSQSVADLPDGTVRAVQGGAQAGDPETLENKTNKEYETEGGISEMDAVSNGTDPTSPHDATHSVDEGVSTQIVSVPIAEGQVELSPENGTVVEQGGCSEIKVEVGKSSLVEGEEVVSEFASTETLQADNAPETDMPAQGQSEGDITVANVEDDKPMIAEASGDVMPAQPTFHPLHKKFVCGRCSKIIALGADFFRCVGHACRDYFVCSECAFERFENDDDAGHHWWHSLFLLRKDLLGGGSSDQPVEIKSSSQDQNVPVSELTEARINVETINGRISKLEEKLTLLDNAIHLSKSSLETKLEEATSSLEAKVERLEAKMDTMMTTLIGLLGGAMTPKLSD